jgi:hypothetical protein
VLDLARQLAEPVDEFGAKRIDVAFLLEIGQPPIECEPD